MINNNNYFKHNKNTQLLEKQRNSVEFSNTYREYNIII